MRFFIGLLLTLNIIYWLWEAAVPTPRAVDSLNVESLQGDAPKLLMANEVPRAMLRVRGMSEDPFTEEAAQTAEAPPGEPAPSEAATAHVNVTLCYEYGPTTSTQARDALVAAVERLPGSKVDVRTEQVVVSTQYWVFIPPYKKEGEAIRVSRQLSRSKVDNFRVTSGEYENAISLGLFSARDSAESVKDRAQKLGHRNVVVAEREKHREEYWVKVEQQVPDQAADLWPQISNKFPKYKRTECE